MSDDKAIFAAIKKADGGLTAKIEAYQDPHDDLFAQIEDRKRKLANWVSSRVLRLSCTANDMKPLAGACGMKPPVHKWKPDERDALLAELDAAYFIL